MKLDKSHFLFIFYAILPYWMCANLICMDVKINNMLFFELLPSVAQLNWLFLKCNDNKFGNGKKYFWVRQWLIILSALLLAFLPIFKNYQ